MVPQLVQQTHHELMVVILHLHDLLHMVVEVVVQLTIMLQIIPLLETVPLVVEQVVDIQHEMVEEQQFTVVNEEIDEKTADIVQLVVEVELVELAV